MDLETLRRRRAPLSIALLALAAWLTAGISRHPPAGGHYVLDSPIGLFEPRLVSPGWRFAPPGIVRVVAYPGEAATYAFDIGDRDATLVSREGIAVRAHGTVRYSLDPDRVLEVHRLLGPRFERDRIAVWILEELRRLIAVASYSDISGARSDELRAALGPPLTDRFRATGLTLLSLDVAGVQIRDGESLASPASAPRDMKVLLIGLDGADWNIIDPLMRAGRLPNLSRLAESGSRGRLGSITPMLSPVVWTSIATGVRPSRHGIVDFLATAGRDGQRVPVTSGLRRTKAIWNILSERGLAVGIVGWWASYPAERVNGFIVSDRVAYQLFGAHPAREQAREGKVHPADLDPLVASLTIAPETIALAEISRYVRLDGDPSTLPDAQNKLIQDLKTLVAAGDTYTRIALALGPRFKPDLTAVYLESTDTVAHLFMPYAPPPLEGVDPADARRFGRAVDEYYRHADTLVGRLVEAAGRDTTVIVCSDHGFRTGENRPLTDSRIGYGQAADWHRKHGIIILNGPPFRRRHTIDEASVLDVTPTLLALFGVPVGEDMDGRPIVDAFDPAFLQSHPIAYVPTHEGTTVAAASPDQESLTAQEAALDPEGNRELKEKLESLGYLKQNTANSHNNRGMILLAEGKHDEAIAEFQRAIDSAEDLAIARLNIARAQFKKKEYDAAIATLTAYLERQPRSKEAENLLGNIAMERNRPGEAEKHFLKALEYEPNFTDARNSLGILYDRLGRHADAVAEFEKVLRIDPDYAEALNNIGVIHKKSGKADQAITAFRDAIRADPDFAGSYSNLALVLEQKGAHAEAEGHYRSALKRDPRNVAVRSNYGGLLYTMGRFDEARVQLEQAVAADPTYASAHNNLGAVYGRLGRAADEIAAYRTAVRLDPDYADVHHNLGLALLKQATVEEGEKELRRALEIDPRYASAALNLGRSLLARGETAEATRVLQETARRIPQGDAALFAALGEAHAQGNRRAEALAAFERSLTLKPDQPELRRRVEALRAAP